MPRVSGAVGGVVGDSAWAVDYSHGISAARGNPWAVGSGRVSGGLHQRRVNSSDALFASAAWRQRRRKRR